MTRNIFTGEANIESLLDYASGSLYLWRENDTVPGRNPTVSLPRDRNDGLKNK